MKITNQYCIGAGVITVLIGYCANDGLLPGNKITWWQNLGTKPNKNVMSEDAQNEFGCKYISSCKSLVVKSGGSFGEKMSKR